MTAATLLFATSLLAQAQAPTVTTDTRFARGATMAFGRSTTKANGSPIAEQGFCWSESPTPTVDDFTTTEYLTNNGRIYWMKDLKPATIYYARAYAKAESGDVGYGDVIKIVTIPKATINLSLRSTDNAEADARIHAAAQTAKEWWTNLTSMRGFSPSVGYVSGVPTADCSYGGWVRVGDNASYQRAGTIMHEWLHGIGVIPWANTEWARFNLRAGRSTAAGFETGSGLWLGDRVTEVLRFWDNNNTSQLNGDYQHMWPYGINGAQEDNGTDVLYIGNSLVCQALGEDGLQFTNSSYAEPYYSFDYVDGQKYYIKNEATTRGLYTAYLVETNNRTLQWKTMTEEEALADDHAAWYIHFTSSNQYYQLQNAATSNYMTYSSNSFRTATRSNGPTSADNLHLMRGRVDVTLGTGTTAQHHRGYWFISPTNNWTPPALVANTNSATAAATFNIANNATTQRWLLLTADNINQLSTNGLSAARQRFELALDAYKALLLVPHTQADADTDSKFQTVIATAETEAAAALSPDIFADLHTQLRAAALAYINAAQPTSADQPFDITPLLADADFSDGELTGWTTTGTLAQTNGRIVSDGTTFHIYQVLTDMPSGNYELYAQGFERTGTLDDLYGQYMAGTAEENATYYLGTTSNRHNLPALLRDRQPQSLHETDALLPDGTYVPTTPEGADAYFANDLYTSSINMAYTSGRMQLGVRNTKRNDTWWTVVKSMRLLYYGTQEPADGIILPTTNASGNGSNAIYDLSGRNVGTMPLQPGIYIINGKKVVVR